MRLIARALMFLFPLAAVGGPGLEWKWSNPQPSGDDLIRVDFTDPQHGRIVADNGTVSETEDGGATWKKSGGRITDEYLIEAAPVDARILVSLSGFGRVWRTSNGGLTWSIVADFRANMRAIESCGDGSVLAAGAEGVIFRSGDRGATWTQVHSDTLGTYLIGIHCEGRRAVVVGESGTVLHSVDGGLHWSSRDVPLAEYLTGVAFSDSAHGFVTTDRGKVAETRDGGLSWRVSLLDSTVFLRRIRSHGSNWRIIGSTGCIWTSRDDGTSWTRSPSITEIDLTSSDFAGDRGGVAVGGNGLILREKTRGGPWEIISPGPTQHVDGMVVNSAGEWLAFGSPGLLLRSIDSGTTWKNVGLRDSIRFLCGAFQGRTGLLVGDSGTIYRTADDGVTWAKAATPRDSARLYGVAWSGPGSATAVGESGILWNSTDSGRSWNSARTPPGLDSITMSAVAFRSGGKGFAVGYQGTFLRTADYGATWVPVAAQATENLYNLSFRDDGTGIAVGGYGLALLTRDGGATWKRDSLGEGYDYLFGAAWVGGDTALIVGNWGHGWFLTLSTDAGLTWTQLPLPTLKELWYIASLGGGRVILTGQNGAILIGTLRSGLPGGPGISGPSPAEGAFTVRRASAAGIRFHVDLASERALTLRAFSLSGRELGTVFRGPLGAGSHTLVLPYAARGPAVFRLEAKGAGGKIRRSGLLPY